MLFRKVVPFAVVAALVSGCVDPSLSPMQNARNATVAVDKAERDYEAARPYAIQLLPYLSPRDAEAVRRAMASIEHFLAIARAATDFGEQIAAIEEARRSLTYVEDSNARNRGALPDR
ncbi:hypothetical protein C8J46_10973 [Sphingomonas sp. PP-F2F-A104-K0414]|uniref:hypothetical protein n=1 Tax=Sphingomonas sp. PP-F2F-A104-K0414 TaxID=2135661 RepID=UPI00104748C8|nr:hypothetical protein [Sphingomonas sp. PP-F2F-A104-K0414]TCP96378.1 hypothetical protein C8J46_10973 [Sphingomonas sp. PP-F2F-A104-K0414]